MRSLEIFAGRTAIWSGAIILSVAAAAARQAPPSPDDLLARYAIDLAAADRDVAPISLDADGSGLHGVAYDRFSLAHLFARGAKSKSTPYDPEKPPRTLVSKQLIVVALPLTCSGRAVRPLDVEIMKGVRPVLRYAAFSAQDFRTWLPGATVPAGAIGVMFNDTVLWANSVVNIRYAGPACPGASNIVSLPVTASDASPIGQPVLKMPEGETAPAAPVTLRIDGIVDLEGRLQYASSREPATPVNKAALTAAASLRFEPARINRSPTPWSAGVILTFSTGRQPAGVSR